MHTYLKYKDIFFFISIKVGSGVGSSSAGSTDPDPDSTQDPTLIEIKKKMSDV